MKFQKTYLSNLGFGRSTSDSASGRHTAGSSNKDFTVEIIGIVKTSMFTICINSGGACELQMVTADHCETKVN